MWRSRLSWGFHLIGAKPRADRALGQAGLPRLQGTREVGVRRCFELTGNGQRMEAIFCANRTVGCLDGSKTRPRPSQFAMAESSSPIASVAWEGRAARSARHGPGAGRQRIVIQHGQVLGPQ